ncbi:sugar transporter [Ilyonectria destructans]|nr:sugar transporter [Ilyonectria destructans]
MGQGSNTRSEQNAVGAGLAQVLPNDGVAWYKKGHLRLLNYYAFSMALLAAANGYDGSMMNGLQALPQWHDFMDNPKGAWLGFINAIQALSSTLAYPAVAYFANRWGRKRGLLIGFFFLFLGAFLQAFTPNSAGFIISRFFLGQPSAWWAGLAPLLITELAYPTHRAFLTSFYNSGWYVGSLLAAWVTYGTRNYDDSWSWRIPSMLQIAIPIVALPAALLIPESPRYLISKGRKEEARQILRKFHAGGEENSALVDFELEEIECVIREESDIASSTSWGDLFNTPGNRHRAAISITLGVFAQWNGVGVVSYYLALVLETVGITSVTDQTLISGCLQVWNLILAVGAAASVDRVGRRFLFLLSSVGMLVSFVLISALSGTFDTTGNKAAGLAVVPFLFIYYGFYDIAFTPLVIAYPAEIWPYTLRARGFALTQLSTYAAIFFNTFVNPIALDKIGWKYYVVFAVILVAITITIYFLYPETRGHSLEEMAVIFDKHDIGLEIGEKLKEDVKSSHNETV